MSDTLDAVLTELCGARVLFRWGRDSGGGGVPGQVVGVLQTVTRWGEAVVVQDNGFAMCVEVHRITSIEGTGDETQVYFSR